MGSWQVGDIRTASTEENKGSHIHYWRNGTHLVHWWSQWHYTLSHCQLSSLQKSEQCMEHHPLWRNLISRWNQPDRRMLLIQYNDLTWIYQLHVILWKLKPKNLTLSSENSSISNFNITTEICKSETTSNRRQLIQLVVYSKVWWLHNCTCAVCN